MTLSGLLIYFDQILDFIQTVFYFQIGHLKLIARKQIGALYHKTKLLNDDIFLLVLIIFLVKAHS